jgi:hypothetical protein
MTQEHPITPPPELLQEWCQQGHNCISELDALKELATQAALWGADQELQACINWLHENDWKAVYKHLCAARRPPNLKEQALAALSRLNSGALCANPVTDKEIIRRALESLPS